MGILIESLLEKESNNSNLSVEAGLVNFTEECFSLEEYYNDIYNEQLNLEIKEFYNEEVDPNSTALVPLMENDEPSSDISSHNKNSFIQNAKNFFIKMISTIKDFISTTFQKLILSIKSVLTNVDGGLKKIKAAKEFKKKSFEVKITNKTTFDMINKLASSETADLTASVSKNGAKDNSSIRFESLTINSLSSVQSTANTCANNIKRISSSIKEIDKKLKTAMKNANDGKNAKDAGTINTKKKLVTAQTTLGRKLTNVSYSCLKNDFSTFKKLVNAVK